MKSVSGHLKGESAVFPIGLHTKQAIQKVNFLTVKVPENLHTTSSSPIKKIYVKKLGRLRSKSRMSEPP